MAKSVISKIFAQPTVEQAQAAVSATADAVVSAGDAVQTAHSALEAAHDTGNPEAVTQAEAAVISAETERDRAIERQKSAQRRLQAAKADRKAEQRTEGVKQLKAACKERAEAAAQIDKAYVDLAAAVKRLMDADEAIASLRHVHSPNAVFAHNYGSARTGALLRFAEARNRIPGAMIVGRNPEEIPSTVTAVERDSTTILLGVDQ